MSENLVLQRLLAGLEAAKVPKRGRNKLVAEKTSYSVSMVAKILTGHAELAPRFVRAVCSSFDIHLDWVEKGQGPILVSGLQVNRADFLDIAERIYKRSGQETKPDMTPEEMDKIFAVWDKALAENIVYLNGLLRRLGHDELKRVEDFIFDLLKQRP